MQQYLPLHRKYRPQTFDDLVGQDVNAMIAQKVVFSNKVPNAFLFSGKKGTGKTSMARIIAKALNCKNYNNNPCNKCDDCLLITDDKYPDVIELDGGSNSSVVTMKKLIENANYGAKYSKYKIFIIDECQMLKKDAWNTLLKTIEEPISTVRWIFCTTEPLKVPDTIKSRCQLYTFNSIKEIDILKRLEYVIKQENMSISKNTLKLIAKKSDGSMRDALMLLEQISIADNVETEKLLLTLVTSEEIEVFINHIISNDYKQALEFKYSITVPDEVFVDALKGFLCTILIQGDKLFEKLSYVKWIDLLNCVIDWDNRLVRAINKSVLTEMMTIKMIDIVKNGVAIETMGNVVQRISEKIKGYHKKIDSNHFVITSQGGNQLHIVNNKDDIDSGYYCLYPEKTNELLKSNKSIKDMIGTIIIKR